MATAPAAMRDVIRQSSINNSFTEALKGIVTIDDLGGHWHGLVCRSAIPGIEAKRSWLSQSGRRLPSDFRTAGHIACDGTELLGQLKRRYAMRP